MLLVEVLLIICILAVSLTAIVQSFLSSHRASSYTKDYALAVLLLENTLQELSRERFIRADMDEEHGFPSPYEKFRYRVQAKNIREGNEAGFLNEATISILWQEGRRKNDLHVTTYLLDFPDEGRNDS